jgi:hypothetical protein
VNDIRPENEKDLEVGVASTIVDKMKPHQVSVALFLNAIQIINFVLYFFFLSFICISSVFI